MLIGEKKIERPLRRGMIGGAFDVDPERNIEFGVKSIGCFIERPYKLHRLLYD